MAAHRRKVFEIHPDPGFYRRRFLWRTGFLAAALAAGWAGYFGERADPSLLYFMAVMTILAVAMTVWGRSRLVQSTAGLKDQVYRVGERSLIRPPTAGKKRELFWSDLSNGSFMKRLGGWDLKLTFTGGSLTIRAVADPDGLRAFLKSINLMGTDNALIKDPTGERHLEMPASFYVSLIPGAVLLVLELFRPVRAEYLFVLLFFNLSVSLLAARKKIIAQTGSKKIAAQLWTPLSLSIIFLAISLFFLYTNFQEAGRWPCFFEP